MADSRGPAAVSVVCTICGGAIRPHDLKSAVQSRVDREDGTWALQYDHAEGDCMRFESPTNAPPMAEFLAQLR